MQDYQLSPYERTKEFVQDVFGHHLSTGTLYNIRQYAFDQLATFEERLKALLTVAVVAGFDETGIRIMAQRLWLHSCSTSQHAYYEPHAKRALSAATLSQYRSLYDDLVKKGLKANPYKPPPKKKRGRKKKMKPRKLVERFRDYADDILRFFYDFKVPFDNNFSERDI